MRALRWAFLAFLAVLSVCHPGWAESAPAVSAVSFESPLSLGKIETKEGRVPLVVAAPHGGFDTSTEGMAVRIAEKIEASWVVAVGFRTFEHPINVNRPTEGVRLSAKQEAFTPRARAIYEAYREKVEAFHPKLYVEIHGSTLAEGAGAIETAAVGFEPEELREIKNLSALPIRVEGLDRLHYRATGAKQHGLLKRFPRALHFEIPVSMRETEGAREKSVETLTRLVEKAFELSK